MVFAVEREREARFTGDGNGVVLSNTGYRFVARDTRGIVASIT